MARPEDRDGIVLRARVNCDPGRLSQLLSNLIANALTHGAAEGPVRVRAAFDRGEFEMSVSNLGEPIPPEAFERLFQPFTRVDVAPASMASGLAFTSRRKSRERTAAFYRRLFRRGDAIYVSYADSGLCSFTISVRYR